MKKNYLELAAAAIMALALLIFFLKISITQVITEIFLWLIILVMVFMAAKYITKYVEFSRTRLIQFYLTHFFAGLIITLFWLVIVLLNDPNFKWTYSSIINFTYILKLIVGVLLYLIFALFHYLFQFYEKNTQNIVRESELKNLVTEAELKSLKFQINPHFIFNSLNSIAALTSIDSEKARDMTVKLADFLRFTLSNDSRKTNRLEDEIKNIERYLAIEKIRFADKFDFVKEVDLKCVDVPVPNMILQPLFENAIKYGVYEALDKIQIRLKTTCLEDFISLQVENDYEDEKTSFKGEGVGLNNIKERLRLFYDRNDLLKVEKGEKFFRVVLYIPVENKN